MKLFLGIEIPDELKQKIFRFLKPIQITSKGWEAPQDYHQTLLFLGETSEEELSIIKQRLALFVFHSFELQTATFEFFNRRILFLSFEPSNELLEFKKEIDHTFPEWLRPNEKVFTPHLTVKRWQRYEYDYLAEGIKARVFPPNKFKVSELVLFKSEKDLENNKYHIIHRVKLKK
ncbi:MAG: RNA 2',3'-cyclic phosphodiesterase [Bacteriovorax sp.]|nr:RNA 2',3'-cyclic phosphodiesterase [Bacteriovorax sp.]